MTSSTGHRTPVTGRRVFWLAAATTGATFLLLLVGGLVNPTGSSLACPDWPLCYGSLLPHMTGGVEYEHTHRLVATAVAVLTCALAIAVWRSAPHRHLRLLAVGAAGLVLLQAVLGGITVLFELPLLVSTAHLAVSMLFFGLLLLLTVRAHAAVGPSDARPLPARCRPATPARPPIRLLLATSLAVYAQILLGGFVRHTGSGRACGESIPWCIGDPWPAWGTGQVHMAHRYVAMVVLVLVLASTWAGVRYARRSGNRLLLGASIAATVLVLGQIGLGVLTVTSYVGIIPVTAHLGVGALLLADTVLMALLVGPARSAAVEPGAQSRSTRRTGLEMAA